MKARHIVANALLMFFTLAIPASHADGPVAYPGYFWGQGSTDFDKFEGWSTQGSLQQGVQWFNLPSDIGVTTYASYRWRLRTQNREFFDEHGPAAGVVLTKDWVNLGYEYQWQTYPFLNTTTAASQLYFTWYKKVYALGGEHPTFFGTPIIGYPTSTWGRLDYDFNNIEGAGSMGFVSQFIEWCALPGDVIFRTQASFNWRVRSKNTDFYNAFGPSAGVEFGKKAFNFGLEYGIQHYPLLQQDVSRFLLYLNWYVDWDLKSK